MNTENQQQWHKGEVNEAYTDKQSGRGKKKVIYALRVSAHSGPGHPSDSAGRLLMCVWAAFYRQSLLPSGRCSLLAACRPLPPAGRAAPLIPYLTQKADREQGTMLKHNQSRGFNSRSVINQYWYWVNSSHVTTDKSNMVTNGTWRHFSPVIFVALVSCQGEMQLVQCFVVSKWTVYQRG